MKLDVGCAGNRLEGYIGLDMNAGPNVDVVHDLTNLPLPFGDGAMEEVFCSHTLEHIPLDYQKPLLCEFRRILAPGGKLRVVAPNFEFYAAEIIADSMAIEQGGTRPGVPHALQHYEDMMALLYRCDNWEVEVKDAHAWMFTAPYLMRVLCDCGFNPVYDLADQGPPHVVVEGIK